MRTKFNGEYFRGKINFVRFKKKFREADILKKIIISGFILIVIHKVIEIIANTIEIEFRGWVIIFIAMVWCGIAISIAIRFLVKKFTCMRFIGSFIFISWALATIGMNFAFGNTTNVMAYRNGSLVIAAADSFLHTNIDFYKPINLFFMKKDNSLEPLSYSGGFHKYKIHFLDTEILNKDKVEIGENLSSLSSIVPYYANEKLGGIKYLGNQRYTFNYGITMSFNDDENYMEQMSIKSKIATYKGIELIGQDLDSFLDRLNEVDTSTGYYLDNNICFLYREYMNGGTLKLVLDDNNIINEVIYENYISSELQ